MLRAQEILIEYLMTLERKRKWTWDSDKAVREEKMKCHETAVPRLPKTKSAGMKRNGHLVAPSQRADAHGSLHFMVKQGAAKRRAPRRDL